VNNVQSKELTEVNNNGVYTINSREVAEIMKTDHKEILSMIEGRKHKNGNARHVGILEVLSESEQIHSHNFFIPSTYKVSNNNKTYKCYLLTKMGCEMIANKMTGSKGILFTAAYVTKFNEMEKILVAPAPSINGNQLIYLTECTLKYVQKVEAIDNKLDKMQDSFDRMFNGLAHIYRNLNKENILVKTSQPVINNKIVKTNLKNIIKKYSEIKKTEEKDIYKLLYSTAKKNIPDCDMYAYAKKSGDKTMLNAIDKMGKLEEVYNLAQELFTV